MWASSTTNPGQRGRPEADVFNSYKFYTWVVAHWSVVADSLLSGATVGGGNGAVVGGNYQTFVISKLGYH